MNFFTDLREFGSAVRFAQPAYLWLALAPLAFWFVRRWMEKRDRARLASLGRPGAIAILRTGIDTRPGIVRLAFALAWLFLVGAAARPRWGLEDERGIAVGRDLVVVLDFSRSMWAEDLTNRTAPARWQEAVAGTRSLVQALRTRGGHRVGIVLFAARPLVLVPLTTDYDHVTFRLEELDATVPPAEIRPADDTAVSGTRIGAALAVAVASHDARFPGFQEIILVTDADDPATDEEWRSGITAARRANIPIHVVGVGDPDGESFVYHRGNPLESPDKDGLLVPVQTKLHAEVAEAIAKGTGGEFFAVGRESIEGEAIVQRIARTSETRELDDERLPQPRERFGWFLGPGLVFLVLTWWRAR
jgi:Ca-activated chloride channel family protein